MALAGQKHTYSGLYIKAANGLRLRDRKVSRLCRRVQLVAPWVERSDGPCLRAWCELEILAEAVYMALRSKWRDGLPEGEHGARLLQDYRQLRQAQTALTRELGLSPASRMAIQANGTSAAFDLAGMIAADAAEPEDASAGLTLPLGQKTRQRQPAPRRGPFLTTSPRSSERALCPLANGSRRFH